jgi:hypothetical protein
MRNPCDTSVSDDVFRRMQATTIQFVFVIYIAGEGYLLFEYIMKAACDCAMLTSESPADTACRGLEPKHHRVGCNRVKNAWELRLQICLPLVELLSRLVNRFGNTAILSWR